MSGESFGGFLDCFDEGVAEFFVSKMLAHSIDQSLPKLIAAIFMNGFVADDGKLMRSRRNEDKNGVALGRLMHAKPVKFLLRRDEWITGELSTLNVNVNFTGRF